MSEPKPFSPPARLPMPPEMSDINLWKILTEIIFPSARDPAAILLALRYCEKRGLDILKRPVNVIPVWSAALGRNIETIWPSITETEITASRSRQWAGLDAPLFGPLETKTFVGKSHATITFPQWCDRTVYRMIAGERRAFTERVHWVECYGRAGGSDAPNYMWAKRPHDQLSKVAKAAALRAAFPEESEGPSDAEMEGAIIPDPEPRPAASAAKQLVETIVPKQAGEQSEATPFAIPVNTDHDWRPFGAALIEHIRAARDEATVDEWLRRNEVNLLAMAARAARLHKTLMRSIESVQLAFADRASEAKQAPHAEVKEPGPTPPDGATELPTDVDPETGEIR